MNFKPFILTLCAAWPLVSCMQGNVTEPAPELDYKWCAIPIDSTWDRIGDSTATRIIEQYSPLLSDLYEVVGTSSDEYFCERPNSTLSSFVADAIHDQAELLSGGKIDLSMTNFGGIRTGMPKGEVTLYDLYAIFPFKNHIVTFDIKGSDLADIVFSHSSKPEAYSRTTTITMKDGIVTGFKIDGKDIDPEKTYRMASINFLMGGGDNYNLSRVASNTVEFPDVLLRDVVIAQMKSLCAEGKSLTLKKDKRVVSL